MKEWLDSLSDIEATVLGGIAGIVVGVVLVVVVALVKARRSR